MFGGGYRFAISDADGGSGGGVADVNTEGFSCRIKVVAGCAGISKGSVVGMVCVWGGLE
jgi:hypothetical protein